MKMFKRMNILQLVLMLSFSLVTPRQELNDITGVWWTSDKESKIMIIKNTNFYSGNVTWLLNPLNKNGQPLQDLRNPDVSKRTRPIIGLEVLSVISSGNNEYLGKIYDAKSGKTYNVTVILNNNKLQINVRVGFLKHQESWTRIPA
jgi:uncharacterized protein (DUF2147 family)